MHCSCSCSCTQLYVKCTQCNETLAEGQNDNDVDFENKIGYNPDHSKIYYKIVKKNNCKVVEKTHIYQMK